MVENPMVVDSLWNDGERHWGVDATGEEIFEGDSIVEIGNEVVLEKNLEDYLIEQLGAKYTIAS
ncbi:hypothetical protein ACFFF5_21200 [Lederbergia wuyishanensis]|uniref:Uncharacterized protein n=1 Tax=Lederbergia wuyishanensis TaxID=1347903 RepID=A0ABU0D796_9BACI|nr:hypothetical protein [Lederbergia wuyishanensis]MCJ8008934.1 hypothetical protein [Lederbergia wuyishanensis]MDQ0344260.1 hypothetical protein [Lederbergia wuyishanensis]